MANSLIKVSQKNQHVIVKNAGGLKGDTGEVGPVGPMGPMGPVGPQGEKGDAASVTVGSTTTTAPGTSALVTNSGDAHDAVLNFKIPRGETGEMGPQGPQGPQGERGATGAQGPKGETGATGAQGIQGPQGPQGPQGIQGPQGEKGDAGAGLVITGSVATYADLPNNLTPADAGNAYFCQADGKLYVWSGTAFPADGDGSQFEGPQGPQGPQGPAGPAGTYTAGSNITISGDTISATDTTYTAGTNVSISQANVISATDTTYSNFTGTDGTDAGTAGLVPAPATTDDGKYLKADGTWADVEGGGVITLKYSDYNPTLVTTPQPLGKFLYESGVKTGDTVVIENDTNEYFMYIVATEGVWYDFTIKTVPCYIVNNNVSDWGATLFQFYIYISGISYKWTYSISGSNYEFGSETVISSNNVKPYGSDYYDPYDVLSAGSGNALSTLVQVATNIAGLSPVEGTFSGQGGFITCDQIKDPVFHEWYGEMEVSSTTPYNFETASVGTTIFVYVRSDAGLPLYYSPTDWAEPFQITDTSGNTIEVSEYIVDQSGQPTSKFVNFVPGKYIMLQKFSNGWGFVNSITDAQYPSRIVNDGAITTAKIADGAVTPAKATNDFALVGTTLSTPSNVAYVATANIQDGAVTSDKIDCATLDVSSYASDSTKFPITYAEIKSRGGVHTLNVKGKCTGFSGGYVLSGLPVPPSRQMAVAVYSDQVVYSGIQSRVGYLTSGGNLELEGRSFANNEEILMAATWVD